VGASPAGAAALLDLVPAPAVGTTAVGTTTVRVADEVIVVDETEGHLHLLNPSGALVWQCLDGGSTLDDICVDLADVLGVPYETVAGDVGALVRRLLDDGLAVAPGYEPPPAPDPGVCDCGATHGPDDVDHIEIRGNP
jgi:hypothetical protein